MKVFDSRKTAHVFAELYDNFDGPRASRFAEAVRKLREKKLMSEEGAYTEFKVTEKEVHQIAKSIK